MSKFKKVTKKVTFYAHWTRSPVIPTSTTAPPIKPYVPPTPKATPTSAPTPTIKPHVPPTPTIAPASTTPTAEPSVEPTIAPALDEIPIDEEHFPDMRFRKVAAWFDLNKDGVLQGKERENVTEIEVCGQEPGSLQGIEFFPSLLVLDCGVNNLTALDVSRNTALNELDCSFNQLAALDLTNNPNIYWLFADDTVEVVGWEKTPNPWL